MLREWAASHPNEEYDARVAAYDARKAELDRRVAAVYEALSEEDKDKVRFHSLTGY